MFPNAPSVRSIALDEIIDRSPSVVALDTPLAEVLALMCQSEDRFDKSGVAGSSCVLVTETGNLAEPLLGMFTERDLIRLAAAGTSLTELVVAAVMTQPAIAMAETECQDIDTVFSLLQHHQIRNLPVVDKNGKLVGAIAQNHLLRALNPEELQQTIGTLQQQVSQLQTEKQEL